MYSLKKRPSVNISSFTRSYFFYNRKLTLWRLTILLLFFSSQTQVHYHIQDFPEDQLSQDSQARQVPLSR